MQAAHWCKRHTGASGTLVQAQLERLEGQRTGAAYAPWSSIRALDKYTRTGAHLGVYAHWCTPGSIRALVHTWECTRTGAHLGAGSLRTRTGARLELHWCTHGQLTHARFGCALIPVTFQHTPTGRLPAYTHTYHGANIKGQLPASTRTHTHNRLPAHTLNRMPACAGATLVASPTGARAGATLGASQV